MNFTFDTGALIALERNSLRMKSAYAAMISRDIIPAVPTPVLVEWWRAGKREKDRARLLRALKIEPLSREAAKLAGTAAGLTGASPIDAIVMATASFHARSVVYTSDPEDLELLRGVFPHVRVEAV